MLVPILIIHNTLIIRQILILQDQKNKTQTKLLALNSKKNSVVRYNGISVQRNPEIGKRIFYKKSTCEILFADLSLPINA